MFGDNNQPIPLGNGKFQTPAGIFNSYAEALRSMMPQMSPAMSQPTFGDKLNLLSDPNAMAKSDASLMSSPAPQMAPVSSAPTANVQDVNKLPPTGAGEPSFWDKLTSKQGIGTIGNAMLAMSQDPSLQKMGMAGIERAQERKGLNATVQMLRKEGQNQLADLIEKNPTMAKTALTQYLQQKYGSRSGIKTSEVKIDPKTGQMFVVETDPNTGAINRRDVTGAIGQTPEEKAGLETSSALKLADMKQSQTAAADAYKQFSNISSQIRNLETIKSSLNTGNAKTGVIDQFLPAFTEATATLRSAANSLGIDVINSATFGALSATELRLALDTALPQGLDEPQLLEWVNKKLEAQKKLQAEIAKQADKLASGVPYTQWVKDVVKPFTGDTPAPASNSGNTVRVKY